MTLAKLWKTLPWVYECTYIGTLSPTFVDGVDHLDLRLGEAGPDVVDLDRGGVG